MSKMEKNIKGKPSKIFGNKTKLFPLVFVYILIIGAGIGFFYLSKMDQIARNAIPQAIQDTM